MENKNNSKSARRKLFFTRCGVFAILLLMFLPMLCSFVSLNAYAAEVTEDNPNVEPIINVWTGIMEWITGSLAAVQGVFFSNDSIRPYLTDVSLTINGVTLYMPDINAVPQDLYYNGVILDDLDLVYEQIDGYDVNLLDGVPIVAQGVDDNGIVVYFNPDITVSVNGSNLTFLGTLAVIGVSISIAFLIIMVIQRFLRLRS